MFAFEPKCLKEINSTLASHFPLAEDYALSDDSAALLIINNVREKYNGSFEALSVSELNYIYSLTKFCTEEEFNNLKIVFKSRLYSALFDIGWIYCQINPNDKRAVKLFSLSCEWMSERKPKDYEKTLIGRTGLPFGEIYARAIEITKIEKITIDQLCEKYNIIINSLLSQQFRMIYLSKCEKEELIQNENVLANLIGTSKIEFLKPVLINYTAKIIYDEMYSLVNDAILYRLSIEDNNVDIGLSPAMLTRIRQQRFNTTLENFCHPASQKVRIYNSVASKIRGVEMLNNGFFILDFGTYIVLDSSDWQYSSFAYTPEFYKKLYKDWKKSGFIDDYWPCVEESLIASARDVVLRVKKADVIKLDFNEFNLLYAKDVLLNTN